MDPTCQTRTDLEHRIWDLSSRLHNLTTKLAFLAGTEREMFGAIKDACDDTKAAINLSRRNLSVHRSEHGC